MKAAETSATVLYQYEISPFCDKVRRALQVKGVTYRVENISVADTATGRLKKLNAAGKVPVLDLDGERLCDSTDIVEELERRYPQPPLIPAHAHERALMHVLEDWADESLYFYEVQLRFAEPGNAEYWAGQAVKFDRGFMRWLGRKLTPVALGRLARSQGIGRKPKAVVLADLRRHLQSLEDLLDGDWLVGNALSLADIAVFVQLYCIAQTPEGERLLVDYPHVRAWMQRVDEATSRYVMPGR